MIIDKYGGVTMIRKRLSRVLLRVFVHVSIRVRKTKRNHFLYIRTRNNGFPLLFPSFFFSFFLST